MHKDNTTSMYISSVTVSESEPIGKPQLAPEMHTSERFSMEKCRIDIISGNCLLSAGLGTEYIAGCSEDQNPFEQVSLDRLLHFSVQYI